MIAASRGVFAAFQPHYAAHHIPTFPMLIEPDRKRPMVKHYKRIGLPASERLARKFSDATALGFMAGERSGITVLDCDSSDERVLTDAMAKHGRSPLIVRSVSGNFQAYYRHGGERRQIRPDRRLPIDILGGGVVVAPPSRRDARGYAIVEGSLDDLENLPPLQNATAGAGHLRSDALPARGCPWGEMRRGDGRNVALWKSLMREARTVDDWDQLLDRAETLNEQFGEPMDSGEVADIAGKVWAKTVQGENRFGRHGAYLPTEHVLALVHDPQLLALVAFLKAHNKPDATFWIADGLAELLNWPRRALPDARRRAIEAGWIVLVRKAAPGNPALYRWGPTVWEDLPILVGNPQRTLPPAPLASLAASVLTAHDMLAGEDCSRSCQSGGAP